MNFLKQWALNWLKPELAKWLKERALHIPEKKEAELASETARKVAGALQISDRQLIAIAQREIEVLIQKVETEIQNAAVKGVDDLRL